MPPETERTLRDLDLGAHLRDRGTRQRFVTRMFDIIAPRYDRFTRIFSFWMDAGWKAELLEPLSLVPQGARVLDLACGTGDLALAAADRAAASRVTGLDASREMTRLASRRSHERVSFAVADMMQLPVPDNSIQAITAGYGFRNVPDHRVAIREAARALSTGGLLLVLDFYRPRNTLWRTVFLSYLRASGNLVGWLWHGEAIVYGYIAPSINAYVSVEQFSADLEAAGFEMVWVRRKLLGGIALHAARKGS